MNPRVTAVRPNDNFTLTLEFANGETRVFDVRPFISSEFFQELLDLSYFRTASVSLGTVVWPKGQDFCPDTLYECSVAAEGTSALHLHSATVA